MSLYKVCAVNVIQYKTLVSKWSDRLMVYMFSRPQWILLIKKKKIISDHLSEEVSNKTQDKVYYSRVYIANITYFSQWNLICVSFNEYTMEKMVFNIHPYHIWICRTFICPFRLFSQYARSLVKLHRFSFPSPKGINSKFCLRWRS